MPTKLGSPMIRGFGTGAVIVAHHIACKALWTALGARSMTSR